MTTTEIDTTLRRYHARLETILTPEEIALHAAYRDRIARQLSNRTLQPPHLTPAERAVVDKIATDHEATALNRQFLALIGVTKMPQ